MNVSQSPEFRQICPQFVGAVILCDVRNSETSPQLWAELTATADRLCAEYTLETIKQQPGIAATRAAYKAAGKDPSRYRPAGEQMTRRILQGKGLYSVSTLVDIGNIVSIAYGYSTGLLDADHIDGDVVLGIGRAEEPYEGIGRGVLNIENLPVYRDAQGGIATPTSDSTRTMLSMETSRLAFFINGYDGNADRVAEAVASAKDLLTRYADAKEFVVLGY